MSQRNPKLINLELAQASVAVEEHGVSDIRTLMNQLQQTAFELRHRLSEVEDERDLLTRKVDSLQARALASVVKGGAPAPPEHTLESLQRQNQELRRAHEELLRQRDELKGTTDGLRRALTDSEQRAIASQSQLTSLRMARDAAQAQNRELSQKLEQSQNRLAELRDRLDVPIVAAAPQHGSEQEELRRLLAQATTALEAAQKRAETLTAEREEATEKAVQLRLELDALREHCRALESGPKDGEASPEMLALRLEKRELTARLEAQRVETIDLAARFQNVQDQLKTLSATLAEARLLAKAARRTEPAAAAAVAEHLDATSELESEEAALVPITVVPAADTEFPSPLAQSTLREMRRCYQAYSRETQDLSHLNELHCAVLGFAEQAARSGLAAVHRIAGALAVLVQELYHFPEQINNEVLTTVVQTIEFLSTTLKLRDLRQLRDPAEITACIVDDDAATCECILLAMESVTMQAVSFREPVKALCEISAVPFDLIILDVHMPEMDGLELCSTLRQQPLHTHTPVLFVTGQPDPETRAGSVLSGGTDFMSKPFMLCELGLKALMLTAKAQLHMA